MNDSQLIPLFRILHSEQEIKRLYGEYSTFFEEYKEFESFLHMQNKFYPNGIIRKDLTENATNYSISATLNRLRQKLGDDAIKEHVTDDGTTFYSLGNINEDFLK